MTENTGFPVKLGMTLFIGMIIYENLYNMKLHLGEDIKIVIIYVLIKHYKEMSLIFLTLPTRG